MQTRTGERRVRVYLEVGQRRVFAGALDWPGWCRSGKGEAAALAALLDYAERYRVVATEAKVELPPALELEVVERVAGSATTDFGAPGSIPSADRAPLGSGEIERLVALVDGAWRVFDHTVAGAPAELRKGPRGGGRDRDKIVAHVREAEVAYARRLGLRLNKPSGQDDPAAIAASRIAILDGLRARRPDGAGWPARYAARRIAWHTLDHAWEIEDRATPAPA